MGHDPASSVRASKDQSSLQVASDGSQSNAWLTIVGIGEGGAAALGNESRTALDKADAIIGAERHLRLLGDVNAEAVVWPVPFADGIEKLLGLRGQRVVMLASGDPFWFGAGSVVAQHLDREEWRAIPAPSTFSLAAARLGWGLEKTVCLGLHAVPLDRLRPHLAPGARAIVLVRDGAAVGDLGRLLTGLGFGASAFHVMEALGGPKERVRETTAERFDFCDVQHPVAVGVEFVGNGSAMPQASGLPDDLFEHDGQLTKRPVRALTMSTLAPRAGEHLWDLGAGSGSIAIEWLLAHPNCQATAVEIDPVRVGRIRTNAARLGVDRLDVVEGRSVDVLARLRPPDAIFIGGGLDGSLLDKIWETVQPGCRIVANAVTLESEALLVDWHARVGCSLLKLSISEAATIGSKRGWKNAYPIVQWIVMR